MRGNNMCVCVFGGGAIDATRGVRGVRVSACKVRVLVSCKVCVCI